MRINSSIIKNNMGAEVRLRLIGEAEFQTGKILDIVRKQVSIRQGDYIPLHLIAEFEFVKDKDRKQ